MGFVVSYIVFIKTLIPQILDLIFGSDDVPDIIGGGQWKGEIVWGSLYAFGVMLPLCLPKKVGSLEYVSTFGCFCALYLTL